jgi:hypothetical protein
VTLFRALVQELAGDHDFIGGYHIANLRDQWLKRKHKTVILYGDCPDRSLVDSVIRSGAAVVLIAEHPIQIAAHLAEERKLSASRAAAVTTQCLAPMHDLFRQSNTYIIGRSKKSVATILRELTSFLGVPATQQQLDRVARNAAEIVKGLTTESHPAPNGPSSRFSKSELITLERVLLPFMDMYDRRSVDRIHWPAGVFYRVDKPDVSVDSRFELTGRARYLAYGPYMHLPTGTWEAELYVEVGDNWSGNVLTVDLEMAGSSRNGKYALPQSGAFRLGFDVEIEDPRAAIEVRLGLAQGAIEGWMELIGFQLTRYKKPATTHA